MRPRSWWSCDEAETLGVLDDHDSSVGDVNANFNDGGRDEDVEFARLKEAHDCSFKSSSSLPWSRPTLRSGKTRLLSSRYILMAALISFSSFSWMTG